MNFPIARFVPVRKSVDTLARSVWNTTRSGGSLFSYLMPDRIIDYNHTETLYTKGTQLMLDPYGKTYTMEMKAKVMGRPRSDVAKIMIEELNLPLTVDEFVDKLQDEIEKLMPTAELLPGAERLLRHMDAEKVPLAIVSGSTDVNHTLKTTNHEDLFSVFSHGVLAGSDPEVKRGKPYPDGFLLARDKFKHLPASSENVLVFEDAPNGVEAAVAAGMPVVWIPDLKIINDPQKHPVKDKATLILDSLEQFDPKWIGLPSL